MQFGVVFPFEAGAGGEFVVRAFAAELPDDLSGGAVDFIDAPGVAGGDEEVAVGELLDGVQMEVVVGLAGRGRVLLRPSGTEPLVRVMVEAPTEAEAQAAADKLAEVVARELGSMG